MPFLLLTSSNQILKIYEKILLTLAVIFFFVGSSTAQKFAISGKIDGLQKGDTLRFEYIVLPGWTLEKAFDIIVTKPSTFSQKIPLAHDQYYMMSYFPKVGKAKACDMRGLVFIAQPNDKITFTGAADQIYYSAIHGGIYDEPKFTHYNHLSDSLGIIRGSYLRLSQEALEKKDTASALKYEKLFNTFYRDHAEGRKQVSEAYKAYTDTYPQGTLHTLVSLLQSAASRPLDQTKDEFAKYSDALKSSHYGQILSSQITELERLSPGQPTPNFSVITKTGKTITPSDFKGRYILIYHWGLCPGSMSIDPEVIALSNKHKDNLTVIGVTESIDLIRQIYKELPADRPAAAAGIADIRPVLENMLQHPWIEVEVETSHPENKSILNDFSISGWPYFVLIDPEGRIVVRDFHTAFLETAELLNEKYPSVN